MTPPVAGGLMPKARYAVVVHAYHTQTFDDLRDCLSAFPPETDVYVSYPERSSTHSEQGIRAAFPGCVPVAVENKGQDIGAFLQVMAKIEHGRYDFFCKLHSKAGDKLPRLWRRALIDGTAGSRVRVAQFDALFRGTPDVMLGGPRELFLHGPSHLMENAGQLEALLASAGLDFDPRQEDWGFFAGTFCWLRLELVEMLMRLLPIEAFGDDAARRDGQLAHAAERLLGLLPVAMGARLALASCIDTTEAPEVIHRFPDNITRHAQLMADRLNVLHSQKSRAQMSALISGSEPGLGFSRVSVAVPRDAAQKAQYTILTPTGDRGAAFNACMRMVAGQTLQPVEWVVVDDGFIPLTEQVTLPDWVTYVRRAPLPDDPPHTLALNVLAGLSHITTDRVLIFEDDDWYAPLYAEHLLPYLESYQMVGLNLIRYYHLRGNAWKHGHPPAHTAFAQTGFQRGHAWDHLAAVCRTGFTEIRERGIVDRHWWHTFEGSKLLINDHPCLHVGLKGGFGRPGLASGHQRREPDYIPDPDGAYLREAIGPETAFYKRWQRGFRKPYALYSAVIGDQPVPPVPEGVAETCDLYLFSDRDRDTSRWQVIPFDDAAARPRAMPHLWFPDHEWSLWLAPEHKLDEAPGALITRAIEAGVPVALFTDEVPAAGEIPAYSVYQAEGWDDQLPIFGCDAIVRYHGDPRVMRAMVAWWQSQSCAAKPDVQLSLAYSLWMEGLAPLVL